MSKEPERGLNEERLANARRSEEEEKRASEEKEKCELGDWSFSPSFAVVAAPVKTRLPLGARESIRFDISPRQTLHDGTS